MKYKIFADRIKLYDSHAIPKANYSKELQRIRNLHPSCRIFYRSECSIKREWAAHTWAYYHNIKVEQTRDVDLEYNQKWYVWLFYLIFGSIALCVVE